MFICVSGSSKVQILLPLINKSVLILMKYYRVTCKKFSFPVSISIFHVHMEFFCIFNKTVLIY